jgi:hypothetical protein
MKPRALRSSIGSAAAPSSLGEPVDEIGDGIDDARGTVRMSLGVVPRGHAGEDQDQDRTSRCVIA